MFNIEDFRRFLLKDFLRDKAWSDYFDAIFKEIIEFNRHNSGTFNQIGFSGAEESLYLNDNYNWVEVVSFDTSKFILNRVSTPYISLGSDNENYLNYNNQSNEDRYLVTPFDFYLKSDLEQLNEQGDFKLNYGSGAEYNLKFTIDKVSGSGVYTIYYCIGGDVYPIDIDFDNNDDVEIDVNVVAENYYFYFYFPASDSTYDFNIKDFYITGIIKDEDNEKMYSLLKKVVNVDNASRFILDKYVRSYDIPSMEKVPTKFLREFVKNYNLFSSFVGSDMAVKMFFYFFSYKVNTTDLYAYVEDYEANNFSFIKQKDEDTFISDNSNVYGELAADVSGNDFVIKVFSDHQIIVSDKISIGGGKKRYVNKVDFHKEVIDDRKVDYLYLSSAFGESYSKGNYIDIKRVYYDLNTTKNIYAVNPDPVSYFKTSHIDVYLIQSLGDLGVDQVVLRDYFESYLPANVVVNFFGNYQAIDPEAFEISEESFSVGTSSIKTILFNESVDMSDDPFYHIVGELGDTPDYYGTLVDPDSLVYYNEDGDKQYLYITF